MYIHIGNDFLINDKHILAILDLDRATTSRDTVDFMGRAERSGRLKNIGGATDLPKSLVICERGGEITIYMTPISSGTLRKRSSAGQ